MFCEISLLIFNRSVIVIIILRITDIIYVLKRFFDQINLSFSLHYFLLLLISLTIFKLIQFTIISSIYYLSGISIWSFSYYIWAVYCLPSCLYRLDHHLFILKLSLGCVRNFMWDISKLDIQTSFPRRFVESCGEGAGWVFRLVWLKSLLFFV